MKLLNQDEHFKCGSSMRILKKMFWESFFCVYSTCHGLAGMLEGTRNGDRKTTMTGEFVDKSGHAKDMQPAGGTRCMNRDVK